ncbi:WASp [Strongyloides ratti]|uniref:WASp n=1 Tax=Strongyloides ratti TaxID=34506 RepID=A0A090L048_STRRB|nr:WASp [Strongyloides ratti]CEF60844.1 WASp [Strongyloides ratti]
MSNYSSSQNNYYQKSVSSNYIQNNDGISKACGTLQKPRRPPNNGSIILKDDENQTLFRLCGPNIVVLAAGVCQLLRSTGKPNVTWEIVSPGVVVLCKDYERRLYCLRLYCLVREELLWEQIMYINFMPEYLKNKRNMLVFEGEKCIYCLNFTTDEEAGIFYNHFYKRLLKEKENTARAAKAQESIHPNYNQGTILTQSTGVSVMGAVPFYSPNQKNQPLLGNGKEQKKNKKKDKGKKICWDQHSGFQHTVSDSNAIDDSVKDVIKAAGFNPDNLNQDEIKFVKDFVSKYDKSDSNIYKAPIDPFNAWDDTPSVQRHSNSQTNYQDTLYNSTLQNKRNISTVPIHSLKNEASNFYDTNKITYNIQTSQNIPLHGKYYNDQNNVHQRTTPAPPPPIRRDLNNFQNDLSNKIPKNENIDMAPVRAAPNTPKRPTNMPPPPPPPIKTNRPPPPPPILKNINSNPIITKQNPAPLIPTSTLPSVGSSAPPPPPPPPPGLLKSSPPSLPTNTSQVQKSQLPTNNGRGDLLAEIQAGKALKKVEQSISQGGKSINTRDDLLAQIQKGTNLRHVESDNGIQNRKSSGNLNEMDGIAGALARALEERRKNMLVSDSEDSDVDNDEWDSD